MTNTEQTKAIPAVEKPSLWNPNAAANWSLLFSPIFGAWLHAKNWEALKDTDKAKKSMYWVYAGVVLFVVLLFMPDSVGSLPWFVFLIAWYFIMARQQSSQVKATLNNEYIHRSWKEPLKYAGIAIAVLFTVVWLAEPSYESSIESDSVAIVTQILAEQASDLAELDMIPAECVRVIITEKITDNMYRATATLDNGNDLVVTIKDEGDTLSVQLNPFQ